MERALTPSLAAGAIAGIAGLVVFLVVHALWIRPIWFITPVGMLFAVLGGLSVGWAYAEILPRLPARPWTALAVAALFLVILLPGALLAEAREPFPLARASSLAPQEMSRWLVRGAVELLLTAALAGGLSGWLLGRSGRAAFAMALAGLVMAIGPGHNIPMLGGTPAVGKGLALVATIVLTSALALVEGHARLLMMKF